MFWNSFFFWIGAALILLLTLICLAVAIYIRRKRQENKFIVQIENLGNVTSQFLLRLVNDDRSLVYRFTKNSIRLPVMAIAGLPGSSQAVTAGAVSAPGIDVGSQAQSAANTLVQYGPSEVSHPLVEANSTIYQGQAEVGRVQYYLQRLGLAGGSPKKAEAQAITPPAGDQWAVTEEVQPGKVLPVEMTVRKKHTGDAREWTFQLISRAREDESAPTMVQEGKGKIPAGFWMRPVYPELVIIGAAILLVIVVVILTIVFYS